MSVCLWEVASDCLCIACWVGFIFVLIFFFHLLSVFYPNPPAAKQLHAAAWAETWPAKECSEEKGLGSRMMPYEPVGLPFQKESGETGEGPEEVCQDGVRGLRHKLRGESEGTGPLQPAEGGMGPPKKSLQLPGEMVEPSSLLQWPMI